MYTNPHKDELKNFLSNPRNVISRDAFLKYKNAIDWMRGQIDYCSYGPKETRHDPCIVKKPSGRKHIKFYKGALTGETAAIQLLGDIDHWMEDNKKDVSQKEIRCSDSYAIVRSKARLLSHSTWGQA